MAPLTGIARVTIPNASGDAVPLSSIARVVMGSVDPTVYREDGADERVELGELQVLEPQLLVGDAALLEEELPWRDGRPDDRDDHENEA